MLIDILQNQINSFIDFYKNKVEFSYAYQPFSNVPKHVWVVCKWKGKWLLTRHEERGIEFPGGKVEEGEKPEEAAKREVYEETGGIVETLTYIGQYRVTAKHEIVIKNVYFAQIERLEEKKHYYETFGPILLQLIPHNIKSDHKFSFIMKDDVLVYSLKFVNKQIKANS